MTMVPTENLSKQHHHHHHHSNNLVYYSSYGFGCGGGGGGGSSIGGDHLIISSHGTSDAFMKGYECNIDQNNNYSEERSDLVLVNNNQMAEDESRTNSLNEAATTSTSKGNSNQEEVIRVRDDDNWLQLSIGGGSVPASNTRVDQDNNEQVDPTARRGGLIELDLLPDTNISQQQHQQQQQHQHQRPSLIFNFPMGGDNQFRAPIMIRPPPVNLLNIGSSSATNFSNTSLFFQGISNITSASSSFNYPTTTTTTTTNTHQEINWAPFRPPIPIHVAPASSSSTSCSSPITMPYFTPPFQFNPGLDINNNNNIRLIDPPRRPHSGVWFILQASQNQAKEPFLPQIPKSFIRIKDGRMTVRLLIKYLVNKLKLDSELEVEIRCRGQELEPLLTLQHVRDNIWIQRDAPLPTLLHSSSTTVTDHLMVLHYGRTRS